MIDHLYVIEAQDSRFIKVGRARNPGARLSDLQVANYEELRLIRVGLERGYAERAVHSQIQEFHLRGEWFSPGAWIYLRTLPWLRDCSRFPAASMQSAFRVAAKEGAA